MKTIAAAQFKAQCLKLMDEVEATRQPILITKRRHPVARLMPVERQRNKPLGWLEGKMWSVGDIVPPITPEEDWAEEMR